MAKDTHAEVQHDGYHEATPFFLDTATWVLIPFLIVIGLFIYLKVPGMLARSLDERSKKIADELEAARALREEAQELLATYQRKRKEAEEEAQGIIEQAKTDASRMAEEARMKLEEQTTRRLKNAEDKIARAEAQAINEIRQKTADLSTHAAQQLIQNMDDAAKADIMDNAVSEVSGKLH